MCTNGAPKSNFTPFSKVAINTRICVGSIRNMIYQSLLRVRKWFLLFFHKNLALERGWMGVGCLWMYTKIRGGCVLSLLLNTNGGGGRTLQRVKINLGGSLGLVLEVCTILNGAPFGQNFIYYGAPFQAEMRTQGCVITWQLWLKQWSLLVYFPPKILWTWN